MRSSRLRLLFLVSCASGPVVGCSSAADTPIVDAGVFDAGSWDAPASDARDAPADVVEAAVDASADVGLDVAVDAADATVDAGPTCTGIVSDETFDATLRVTADDYREVYVNGTLVEAQGAGWGSPSTQTVQLFLNPTVANVIAVLGVNAYSQGGYDRGIVVDLSWSLGDAGQAGSLVSDASWRVQQVDTVDAGPDWMAPRYDDSAWPFATDEGPHGMGPWGSPLGTSAARWIWFYDSSTATTKPASESAAFRRTFYVTTAGQPSEVATGCP